MSRDPHSPPAPAARRTAAPVGPRRAEERGSVLIFVVGVLLLLAIIATAFLGATRSDRVATQQNAFTTQIDLLLEGIVNAAKAKVSADNTVPGDTTSDTVDAYAFAGQLGVTAGMTDDWLASRIPTLLDRTLVANTSEMNVGSNGVIWPVVSSAVLADRFESPALFQNWPPGTSGQTAYTGSLEYSPREQLAPSFMTFGGKTWPAFVVDTYATPLPGATGSAANQYRRVLAADADGDGIADSGLFRIPIGQLAGVTYYGAVRIIDNSSAINLNTAMSRDIDFGGNGTGVYGDGTPFPGSFTSSIGLVEMLRSASTAVYPALPAAPQFDNMYSGAANEFELLNIYRFGLPTTATPPLQIDGVQAGTTTTPLETATATRSDFSFVTMGEALNRQLGERIGAPGYTVANSAAKSAFTDSLALASRFSIGSTDDTSNALLKTLITSVQNDPFGAERTTPYTGASGAGVGSWFGRNFNLNYDLETTSVGNEDVRTPTPATYMNRRTLLTAYNATSNLQNASIVPIDLGYLYNSPLLSTHSGANDTIYRPVVPVGSLPQPPMMLPGGAVAASGTVTPVTKVAINQARFEELFYGFFQVMARPSMTGDGDDRGTPFSTTDPIDFYQAAIAARSTVAPNAITRQFSNSGYFYRDPYIGMRFDAPTGAAAGGMSTNRLEPTGLPSVITGQTGVTEQHPLRQFRSVLRAPHDRLSAGPAYWDQNTTFLPADQVLVLRAAIAAANAEALRNNSIAVVNPVTTSPQDINDRITPHKIPLIARLPPNNSVGVATANTNVVATVFGLRRQPYITEVFVNTNPETTVAPLPNPKGYIAVKISNPYPVPISLQYCRLVGLRRYRELPNRTTSLISGTSTLGQYPNMEVVAPPTVTTTPLTATNDQINLSSILANDGVPTPPWVIPANGALILENYPGTNAAVDANSDAGHRPLSAGLPSPTGTVASPAAIRVAYAPYLESVVYDRELVLVRPFGATPPDSTAATPLEYTAEDGSTGATSTTLTAKLDQFAPLDSYDFTGLNGYQLTNGPVRPDRVFIWHYVRPSGDGSWRWVYPGRYDGDQSIPLSPAVPTTYPRPRQQGTEEGYNTADTLPGLDPTTAGTFSLVHAPTLLTNAIDGYYPDDGFCIQLNNVNWPGINQMHAYTGSTSPNLYPFGGFARSGDLLKVPFIGSYTIQTETAAVATGTTTTILEMNSVTMDAALAEDTDVEDNAPHGGEVDGTKSREQIGRFCPLRSSRSAGGAAVAEAIDASTPPKHWSFLDTAFTSDQARYQDELSDSLFFSLTGTTAIVPPTSAQQSWTNRYQWTTTLFDHFTLAAPQDDGFANYPTQPKWRPGVAYVPGDAVQFGDAVYVCKTAQAASAIDPPAAGTLNPGSNTATWDCLRRVGISNNGGKTPGNRTNVVAGSPSIDYLLTDDNAENTESVQGLININTASAKVLAMVPWVKPGDNYKFVYAGNRYENLQVTVASDGVPDNEEIAQAIVMYRDGNLGNAGTTVAAAPAARPFASLYDLYNIPAIRLLQNQILAAGDPLTADGDYSGTVTGAADGVRNDFEEQYLLLNKVSSLLTTRSDTFTIYALVQGWRNVGTAAPELVTQRRAALIIDRSALNRNSAASLKQVSKVQTQ